VSGGGVLDANGNLVGIPVGRMDGDYRFSFILPFRSEMFRKVPDLAASIAAADSVVTDWNIASKTFFPVRPARWRHHPEKPDFRAGIFWPLSCITASHEQTIAKEAQMIRSLYAVPAMFCLSAALLTAQAPAGDKPASNPPGAQEPATQKPSTPSTSSASSAGKVTYTGCVKPGTSADSWILENAETQRPGAASTPGSVGTSGTSKMTVNLDPAASVNLKAHANHKVEVTGTVKSGASASPGAGGAAGASSSASGQTISVDSVKMVSATCP
jgi:hypothetical protein